MPKLKFYHVPTADNANSNWGYNLVDRLEWLTVDGEWFFDAAAATPKLYYKKGNLLSGAPSNVKISTDLCQRGILIDVDLSSNTTEWVSIQGLTFEHYADELYRSGDIDSYMNWSTVRGVGIRIAPGEHQEITIDRCTFRDLRFGIENALNDPYSEHMTYSNNTFSNVYSTALRCGVYDAEIAYNRFERIAMEPGQAFWTFQATAALEISSEGFNAHHNVFLGIGGTSISLGNVTPVSGDPEGNVVEYNYFKHGQMVLNDHASITFDNCDELIIRNNIIGEMIPDLETSADGDYQSNKTVGIYFGYQETTNVLVQGNMISNVGNGIAVDHDPGFEGNRIEDNTVFNCGVQLAILDRGDPEENNYSAVYDDEYSGNILYCLSEEQLAFWQNQQKANSWDLDDPDPNRPLAHFGTFSDNYYFNPFSDLVVWISTGVEEQDGSLELVPRTFSQWQAMFGEDMDSHLCPIRQERFEVTITGGNIVSNGDFEDGVTGWRYCGVELDPGPFEGPALVNPDAGCEWTENNGGEVVNLPAGSYLLTASLARESEGVLRASLELTDNNPAGPWIAATEEGRTIRAILNHPTTSNSYLSLHDVDWWAQDFGLMVPVDPYPELILDEVSVEPCSVTYWTEQQMAEHHILRYYSDLPGTEDDPQNVASTGGTFDLAGCWADVHGNFYTGTVTLDPWKSIVLYRLDTDYDITELYNVNGTEVWDEDMKVKSMVVVHDEATLAIEDATIGFASGSSEHPCNITVEPGGRLILNNAVLTTAHDCDGASVWQGVVVLGDVTSSQVVGNQGYVELNGGSIIEHAVTGIYVGDPDDQGAGGGIVRMAGTQSEPPGTIRDCRTGIFFRSYGMIAQPPYLSLSSNTSRFQHAQFLTDDDSRFIEQGHIAHVKMDGVNNMNFGACSFRNIIADVAQSHLLGHGIYAIDSRFRVRDACPDPVAGCSTGRLPSAFVGLDHGVHALGGMQTSSFSVERSSFENNICGVFSGGITSVAIRDNFFELGGRATELLGNAEDESFDDLHRGIYAYQSNGLRIEGNELFMTTSPAADVEGVVVGYSGQGNEVVGRNNTAAGLGSGFVGEGDCGMPDMTSFSGLQFLCNTNDDNIINFWSRSAGSPTATIRRVQGGKAAADNVFDQDVDNTDFDVSTLVVPITYRYRTGTGLEPVYFSDGSELGELQPSLVSNPTASYCTIPWQMQPALSTRSALWAYSDSLAAELGVATDAYNAVIDRGDMGNLLDRITSFGLADTVAMRDTLLACSPYLSNKILRAAMEKDLLSEAMLGVVLKANPEATKEVAFIYWLFVDHAKFRYDPRQVLDTLRSSWSSSTARADLEADLAHIGFLNARAASALVETYATDSAEVSLDSLAAAWHSHASLEGTYAEAMLLAEMGEFDAARDLLEAPERLGKLEWYHDIFERLVMTALVNVFDSDAQNATSFFKDLPAGEAKELASNITMALLEIPYNRGFGRIDNLLCFHHGLCRPPLTGGDKHKMLVVEPPADNAPVIVRSSAFGVAPNPAHEQFTVRYRFADDVRSGTVCLRDITGRLVLQEPLAGGEGNAVLATGHMGRGAYLLEVRGNGVVVHQEKILLE